MTVGEKKNKQLNRKYSILIIAVSLFFIYTNSFAVIVEEIGVGSAGFNGEVGEVQELRSLAITNLLEVAVIRVSGVIISGEKSQTMRASDSYETGDDGITEKLKQDTVFHNTVVSRTSSYAKIKEILEEWKEGDTYYIRAKVDVSKNQIKGKLQEVGIYWDRVGNPSVHMSLSSRINNSKLGSGSYAKKYLTNSLSKNGILVETSDQNPTYSIHVDRDFSTTYSMQYGHRIHTIHCSFTYELKDVGVNKSIASETKSAGPIAGFTSKEAQAACEKDVLPKVARSMVNKVTEELNNIWNNGRDYLITIENVKGSEVAEVASKIRNIFRVTNLSGLKFKKRTMQAEVKYKGTPFEFVDNLVKTFDFDSKPILLESIVENVIGLRFDQ